MGQEVVYSKASELIELFGQIQVNAKQIDRVCNYYGEQIYEAEINSDGRVAKGNDSSQNKAKVIMPSSCEHLIKALTRLGRI